MKGKIFIDLSLFVLFVLAIILGLNERQIIKWQKSDDRIKTERFVKLENKNAEFKTEFRKTIQAVKKITKDHDRLMRLFSNVPEKQPLKIEERIERLDSLFQKLAEEEKLLDFKIDEMNSSIEKSKRLQFNNTRIFEKKLNESKTEIAILKKQNEAIIGLLYQNLSKREKLLKKELKVKFPELVK